MIRNSGVNVVRRFFPDVDTVIDATENYRVTVTRGDCNSAAVKKHRNCALAVACKRQLGLDGAIISRSMAYLVKGKKATRYTLPQSIRVEIISFDRNGGFQPGVYELSKIMPSMRPGYHWERVRSKKVATKTEDKLVAFRHYTMQARKVLGGHNPESLTAGA